MVSVLAEVIAARETFAETDNELSEILGTRVIEAAIGIITSSPGAGTVPPDQFVLVVQRELPLPLVHVMVDCP